MSKNLDSQHPPTGLNTLRRNDEISRIINIIRDIRSGCPPDQSWLSFSLTQSDFQTLLAEIKVQDSLWGYFEDKIRLVLAIYTIP